MGNQLKIKRSRGHTPRHSYRLTRAAELGVGETKILIKRALSNVWGRTYGPGDQPVHEVTVVFDLVLSRGSGPGVCALAGSHSHLPAAIVQGAFDCGAWLGAFADRLTLALKDGVQPPVSGLASFLETGDSGLSDPATPGDLIGQRLALGATRGVKA